jgi:hypothetical protein
MEGRMQRRNFLATLGLAIAAPWSAPAARPPRIGFLSGGDENGAESFVTAMRDGLQAEGYTEPGTMTLDRVYADYALDKVPTLVAELQRRGADLIVPHAAATPIVVQDKERLVPPVYEFSADPIEVGIARDRASAIQCDRCYADESGTERQASRIFTRISAVSAPYCGYC